MKEVRGSEVQDFLRCRLRWKYRWVDQLVSRTPNTKLFFGTLFHKFLEEYYRTEGDSIHAFWAMDNLFQETDTSRMDQLELDELFHLASTVSQNYLAEYRDDFEKYEVVATELQFSIPLDEEISFTGTIDLVLREKETGDIYFMDHKTTASIEKYEKNAIMDRQISRYWWALQQLGYEPKGFFYNIILKDYPVPPQELKKGGLSKNKAQKTTYKMYTQKLMELEIAACDNEAEEQGYKEILDHLKENPKPFFKRLEVYRNQQEIDASINEFYATARDVDYYNFYLRNKIDDRPYNPIYRNITQDCHWDCSFKDVCVAGFDGSNVEFLLNSLYVKDNQ